ncbi:ABC transporter ATP-binding protein [Candidatus Endobugula sertula]|uniref:ABC transporter ATP-binding protein n=1 Tax=Candidatus Endobugula sertula TaxID=62101 RepID=A0A1D2QT28_9GAMM|nr:ABC transporter ATP-binding protein [Candidatus Endobugula sertula]
MTEKSNSVLRVSNLITHIHGAKQPVKAINDIHFSIAPGETFALVGESGSGKSMTALSIMRLLPSVAEVKQGEILFQGKNLLHLTEAEMRNIRGTGIGMIFQEPMTSLNPIMTIGQQIVEAVANAQPNLPTKQQWQKVSELLELVSIKNYQDRINEYPHQFSGGMRQRVMIAIALAGEPELLIADEPTTALDVTTQAQVLTLIQEIQQKRKMAVLLITHDLGIVHDMADHIAVMRHGKILETADSKTFFKQPQHSYSRSLFEVIPSLAKRGKKLTDATILSTNSNSINGSTANTKGSHNNDILLSVNNLKTYFPIKKGVFRRTVGYVEAIDGVSLNIQRGKTLALVGESGSGKTTLAKTVIRLLNHTDGDIVFAGNKIDQQSKKHLQNLRAELQIVFQDPYSSMNPRMLVRDILSEGMKALKVHNTPEAREQRMLELLELVGLDAQSLNRYPHQFSGGQRQRISIARALAVNPKLIICDEPTSALDVSVQAQILNLLKDLQDRLGISYLFITHDISVVSYIADEVAVMYNGKIVEQGSVEDIILKPEHDYTKTLMSAVPTLYKAT